MIRFSDFLKKEPKAGLQRPPAIQAPGTPPGELLQSVPREMPRPELPGTEIYEETLRFVEKTFHDIENGKPLDGRAIQERVNRLIDPIAAGSEGLLIKLSKFNPEIYLYAHCVNVAILAIQMGIWLGYNKSKLISLGVGALLHDLGMIRFRQTIQLPRSLTKEESEAIKTHPLAGAEILRKTGMDPEAIRTVLEHHERIDQTGYPQGLGGDEIHEYAKIVSVMDIYDAVIHIRPYRKRFMPAESIKEILTERHSYHPPVLKLLLERIGLYPQGSWVELSTGEIARVLRVNKGFLFLPTVIVIFSREGEALAEIQPIDLSKQTGITIVRSLYDEEFK